MAQAVAALFVAPWFAPWRAGSARWFGRDAAIGEGWSDDDAQRRRPDLAHHRRRAQIVRVGAGRKWPLANDGHGRRAVRVRMRRVAPPAECDRREVAKKLHLREVPP